MGLVFVTVVVAGFILFFSLKVNGNFDFTHRFGIRDIEASIDQENVMLMLDEDMATSWNAPTFLGETLASPGDHITIFLDGTRSLSGIRLYGCDRDDLIIMTDEGRALEVSYQGTDEGRYVFDKAVSTETLTVAVPEGEDIHWSINEIELFE